MSDSFYISKKIEIKIFKILFSINYIKKREMKVLRCCRIDNQVIGIMEHNIRFIIPVKRFQIKYGYVPSMKTYGSKFKDNNILFAFNAGYIDYDFIIQNKIEQTVSKL